MGYEHDPSTDDYLVLQNNLLGQIKKHRLADVAVVANMEIAEVTVSIINKPTIFVNQVGTYARTMAKQGRNHKCVR